MDQNKSLDKLVKLIATLLCDVQTSHVTVFTTRALRLTTKKLESRVRSEGISFLTKTLPRLGKALDKALAQDTPLNSAKLGFKPQPNSKLPKFMGEFFNRVLDPAGMVLPDPCAESVRVLRDITYLFYKYELPYTDEQEQTVLSKFERTEEELLAQSCLLRALHRDTDCSNQTRRSRHTTHPSQVMVAREARILLSRVFSGLDLKDIIPRHGPGAVATRQRLWGKYEWTNVSHRITEQYPLDEFFYSSLGAVCDSLDQIKDLQEKDLPAKVILVPKDSRGPRLISCEPVDFQWIQQGIMTKIVSHVEALPLTRFNVFFTDQEPNRRGALLGSIAGKYSTLDLNEASDRVSLDLVHLLFPSHVCEILDAVRSSSTELPSGRILKLNKFAPMGSALCFPILALTVWAILTAAASDADTRSGILVYGDDVIVPKHYALNAIEHLESFGLRVNRDKSCINGLFRESCGMDAINGVCVTPVRIRTVWSSSPCPETYVSWISYANSLYDRRYYSCYDYVVGMLHSVYGAIPDDAMSRERYPSLREVPEFMRPKKRKWDKHLQKWLHLVRVLKAPTVRHEMSGWSMLLRHFVESSSDSSVKYRYEANLASVRYPHVRDAVGYMGADKAPFSVREYTMRHSSMLLWRWR